jgi:hypothetical protein
MKRFESLLTEVWACTIWLRRNPWSKTELLPSLQQRVADVLSG